MKAPKALRNALIEQKRSEGTTLAALVAEFGITASAIRQILLKQERNKRRIKERLEAPFQRTTRPSRDG